jgi:predicted metal-dependent phosphoesterase TrpH
MKLDAHVHTYYSGNTTLKYLNRIMKESYSTPEQLYRVAKSRDMDLVTITDHDAIGGVLTIADRPDVIVGCEITAIFPEDGEIGHIGVLGITEAQHRESQRLRHNAHELVRYLKEQQIFCTLNHLASLSAGRLTAAHIFSVLPWISAVEIKNGTRLKCQNRTAAALAKAHGKVTVAGSDSHTYRGIGKTYMVCDNARNREEFLFELRQGRVRVEGREGGFFTLASDILRTTANFYREGLREFVAAPLEWKRQLRVVCSTLGLPLTAAGLIAAFVHFVQDERFNDELLLDLLAGGSDLWAAPNPAPVLEPAIGD